MANSFRHCLIVLFTSCFAFGQSGNLDSLITVANGLPNNQARIALLLNISTKFLGQAKFDMANHYAQVATDIADSLLTVAQPESNSYDSLKMLRATACNNFGAALFNQGRTNEALNYFNTSLSICEAVRDKKGQGNALSYIGNVHVVKGEYAEALKKHLQVLQIRTELDDPFGIASAQNNLGNVYMYQGYYSEALKHHFTALAIREELQDKKGIAASNGNIAGIYNNQGNYDDALIHHQRCSELFKELNDNKGLSGSLNNLGNLHTEMGNYIAGLSCYRSSLALKQVIGDKRGMATINQNLGIIYLNQGNFAEARKYQLEAQRIFQEVGDVHGVAESYSNLGSLAYKEQDLATALALHQNSYDLRLEIGDQNGIAISLQNLGTILGELKKFDEALTKLRQANDIEASQDDLRGMSIVSYRIGGLHLSRSNDADMQTAISNFQQSISYARKCGFQRQILESAIPLVISFQKLNNPDSSIIYLSMARSYAGRQLNTNYFNYSEKEKQMFIGTLQSVYDVYYEFALTNSSEFPELADTALNLALANKGLALRSSTAIRQSILSSADTNLINDYHQWLSLKKKLTSIADQSEKYALLEKNADSLEESLVLRSGRFSDYTKILHSDWLRIRNNLSATQAAIEFIHFHSAIEHPGEVVYMAMIIRKNSKHPEMIKMCTENQLIEILGSTHNNNFNYVNMIYGTNTKTNKKLYEIIWRPLEQSLLGIDEVFYSPSGLLHKLSLPALSGQNNLYLCDNFNMRCMGSTAQIQNGSKSDGMFESFLLIGGVDYHSDSSESAIWSYLPGTLHEIEGIKKQLSKSKVQINAYSGLEATEGLFKSKASSASICHISTHGFFFPDPDEIAAEFHSSSTGDSEPVFRGTNTSYANWSFVNNRNPLMRSGLVLARANDVWQRSAETTGEDGILTAREVSTLDLQNTKLVVLSACETGLGDIKGSEGVYGLQRAFKMAGVKYIIMSLWQVPDKETAEFMTLFYKNLTKVSNIRKAFTMTQKTMREKYDPYYWAAFVLVE